MSRIRRVVLLVAILGVLGSVAAAAAPASTFARCGARQAGALLSPHWVLTGIQYISISHRTAVRVQRETGPGVEGFHPTVFDIECGVAWSVAARASQAWVRSPTTSFALVVRMVGAGRHPDLGPFRCRVVRVGSGAAGTCRHAPDPHAGRIVVKFRLAPNRG
jgi:hypothetical protein